MLGLWDFSFKYLFSDKTNLFYDHITELSEKSLEKTLPSVEEINSHRPNPNGWSTGMEDSVLTGGLMLDAAMIKAKLDPSEKALEQMKLIYKGLMLCANVSSDKGFVARSVSPFDQKSHYINSSRDQYTHLIFSLTNYYFSSHSTETEKEEIRNVFANIALRLERTLTEENGYEFPREDGKTGLCQKMWGELGKHEYLRLPMFYLAAYKTCDNEHFYELYLKYRDEALEKTEGIEFKDFGHAYPILQMQYSLKYIFDHDNDEKVKQRAKKIINDAAEHFCKYAKEMYAHLLNSKETINYRYLRWDKAPYVCMGVFGDIPYNNHNQDINPENKAYYIFRNIGDAVTICSLSGVYNEELIEIIKSSADLIKPNDHYSNAPLYLLGGYYSMLDLK